MPPVDGRRRRYVPVDINVCFSAFGTKLTDKWGIEGIGAWVLLLAAAKREPVEGTFTYTSELEAWSKMGATARGFTFDEFVTFCGRSKQTRKTRQGRVVYITITGWDHWNRRWRNQQNTSTEQENTDELRGDAPDYGEMPQNATPETETDTESESEVEDRPVGLHNFGNLTFLDSQAHALRLFGAIRDDHKDDGTKHVILSAASHLAPADFDAVLADLERNRRSIRHEGKWVNGALQKRAAKGAAA